MTTGCAMFAHKVKMALVAGHVDLMMNVPSSPSHLLVYVLAR
jgi:hypothetical protein